MALKLVPSGDNLFLEYTPDHSTSGKWLADKLANEGHTFRRTFTVVRKDLTNPTDEYDSDNYAWKFRIGTKSGDYWQIQKSVLGLKYDLLFSQDIQLHIRHFIAIRDISIFYKLDKLIDEQIVIGGGKENAIPQSAFELLVKEFPTTTELWRYADERIASKVSEYLETMTDAESRLANFWKRRRGHNALAQLKAKDSIRIADELDLEKYTFLKNRLVEMLDSPAKYREPVWQKEVADLFLLIYPQYIAVLDNVEVKEEYTRPKSTSRKFDLVLVNATGHIDLIEIKTPYKHILSQGTYRDNYVPLRELSGAIIQAEKYIFYLNKGGKKAEDKLTETHSSKLPDGLSLKVSNPRTIILAGRDDQLTKEQKDDFEFIRRKYVNVMDILTYDDLLMRVDNIINSLRKKI